MEIDGYWVEEVGEEGKYKIVEVYEFNNGKKGKFLGYALLSPSIPPSLIKCHLAKWCTSGEGARLFAKSLDREIGD